MADSDAKPKLSEQDITGLKLFDQLAPLLQRLHDDACQRDTANNRKLFYDQYGMPMLLYFFNPIVTSLRGLQQASELKNVQQELGCARAALGSLSEAATVFDTDRLKEIISELGQQQQPLADDQRLQNIDQTITLVDGSLIAELPELGTLNRGEVAKLVGVAPINKDFGQSIGKRKTAGGRAGVRRTLDMATLVATRFNPRINAFYQRLLANGKLK